MRLPRNPTIAGISADLMRLLSQITGQVNGITEGQASAVHNAATAAPTTGTWAQGDAVMNSNPTELGTGGMKYIVTGWKCTVSGTPGTWVEARYMTGGGLEITKLLTATATLDFGSIAANTTANLTITVTGASVGDHVWLVPPSTLEDGVIHCGGVTAADTVCVRLHNTSGGAIDPASATWRATVLTIE